MLIALLIASAALWIMIHTMWCRLFIAMSAVVVVFIFNRIVEFNVGYGSFLGMISYEYFITHHKILKYLRFHDVQPSFILFISGSILLAFFTYKLFHIKLKQRNISIQ